ncbi:anti-sigma factor family protein [Lachnospiraceae bacterium LCP25S3_G4]
MHVEQLTLQRFLEGTLNTEQYMEVLEHIAECEYCAEEIAVVEMQESRVKAPAYLKEQILTRSQAPDIQAAIRAKKTSKKMQLFYYSAKTATAVIGALLLLIAVTQANTTDRINYKKEPHKIEEVTGKIKESSNQLAGFINEFSNQLINGGITK